MAGPTVKAAADLVANPAPDLGEAFAAAPDTDPDVGSRQELQPLQQPFATMSPEAFLKLEKGRYAFEIKSQLEAVKDVEPDNMARALATTKEPRRNLVHGLELARNPDLLDEGDKAKQAVEIIEKSPPLAAWITKSFENTVLSKDELRELADFSADIDARARADTNAFSKGGTDLKLTHKSIARGLQEFQESVQIREMRSRFEGFDAIDSILESNPGISRDAALTLFLQSKQDAGELDFAGQPTREQRATFSAYFGADEAGRKELRDRMTTRLLNDKAARASFQKLILLYNSQRSDGEELSSDNFMSWMAYHSTASIPIALEMVALGWMTGGTGLVAGATAMELGGANAQAVVMADAGELNAFGEEIDTTDAAFQQRLVAASLASGAVESVFGATTNVVASPLLKLPLFKQLAERVSGRVATLAAARGAKAAAGRGAILAAKTVGNAVGEGFEEVIQGILMDWAVTNGMPDTDDPQFWDRVVEEMAVGMFAGGAISGPMQWRAMRRGTKLARLKEAVGRRDLHINEAREDVRQAQLDSDWIMKQNQKVEELALPKRSPEAFADFINEHGLNQSSIYIDAETAQALPADVRQALDITAEALQIAAETEAAVEVNLGRYMQTVPGVDPETAEMFVNHGFLQPGGIGKTQAAGLAVVLDVEAPLVHITELDPRTGLTPEATLAAMRETFVSDMIVRMNAANGQAGRNRPAAEIYGGFMNAMAAGYGSDIYEDLPGVAFRGPAQRTRAQLASETTLATSPGLIMNQQPAHPERAAIHEMIEQGADAEEFMVAPQLVAILDHMAQIPETIPKGFVFTEEYANEREFLGTGGQRIVGVDTLFAQVDEVSAKAAGGVDKIRSDMRADILIGPPAAGKSTVADLMAPETGSRIIDSDEIKLLMPEYANGMGTAAVHEESSMLGKVLLDNVLETGDNIIIPKVGDNPDSIRKLMAKLREAGYTVHLNHMVVDPSEAFRRSLMRYVHTGRLVPPEYILAVDSKPGETYELLKGEADGYAAYDSNVPHKAPIPVIEESVGFRGVPRGPFDGDGRADQAPQAPARRYLGGTASSDIESDAGAATLNQSALSIFDDPGSLQVVGTKKGGKASILDIGKAFMGRHQSKFGRKLVPEDSEEDFQTVLEALSDEIEVQLQQKLTGVGWYGEDTSKALGNTAKVYPKVATAEGRSLYLMLAGIMSVDSTPRAAWKAAELAYRVWDEKGILPTTREAASLALDEEVQMSPDKDGPKGWTHKNTNVVNSLRIINVLVERTGSIAGAAEWLTTKQTRVDINDVMLKSGLVTKRYNKKESAGTPEFGALALGPKIGPFFATLHGIEVGAGDTTVDKWYVRTYRRLTGRLLDGPLDKAGVTAQPDPARGGIERETIFRLTGELADRFGLAADDIQAVLWYFEKALYKKLGVTVDEGTNSDGARELLEKHGIEYDDGARSIVAGSGSAEQTARGTTYPGQGHAADANRVRRTSNGSQTYRGRTFEPVAEFDDGTGRPIYEIDDPGVYRDIISEAKAELGDVGAQVDVHDDYAGTRMFLFDEGDSGFVLEGDDIVSVFSVPEKLGGSAPEGAVARLMSVAIQEGGRRLDAFDTFLPKVYAREGFQAVATLKWNPEFSPDGWNADAFAKWNKGKPAVIFMVYNPQGATDTTTTKVNTYEEGLALQAELNQPAQTLNQSAPTTNPFPDSQVDAPVFHRTSADFEKFRLGDPDLGDFNASGPALWFGSDPGKLPQSHSRRADGDRTIPVFLNIENPLLLDEFNLQEQQARWADGSKDFPFLITEAQTASLTAAGFDGVIAEDIYGLGEGNEYLVWTEGQVRSSITGEQLFQTRDDTPRGSITLPPNILSGKAVIDIFEKSDASTIPHELSHYFLAAFQWVAQQEHVPQSMKDDLAKMNVELGREEGDMSPWTVDQQEQFAESFENYVMEGKAPSSTLRKAFRKLSAWMVEVYNKLSRNPGFRPTPQMSELIDRMIATETEIELAKEVAGAKLLLNDTHVGMTKDTYEVHKSVAESSEALAYGRTLAVAMKKIKRRRTKEYKARLDELREEVRAEVEARPVYGAISLLGASATLSLDKKQIVDLVGPEALVELTRAFHGTKTNLYKEGGADIEVIASDRGYDSAGQMIKAIRSAAPINDLVEKTAKDRVEREMGDPANDADIREEAEASINNADHNELVAREVVKMAKEAKTPRAPNSWQILNAAVREQAEDMVDGMRVRDIIGYRKFLTASKKAARTAEKELTGVVRRADGTPTSGGILALQRAVAAKNQQLLNDHLYRISRERALRVKAALKRYQRMSRTTTRQAIGPDFMDQIDAKLDQYDFRTKSEKQVRHEAKMSYDAFRQQMIADGRQGELPDLDGSIVADSRVRHYTDLTGKELEGVMSVIDNLSAMGRSTTAAQKEIDKLDLAERSQAVVNSIEANLSDAKEGPRESGQRTKLNKFGDNLTIAQLMVQNARTITRRWDGWKDGGLAQKYIYRPLAAAANVLETRRADTSQQIADLYKKHFTSADMKKLTKVQWRPEIGMELSHAGILSLALNTGNVTNFDRLVNSSKDPFTPENLQALFDEHLTDADWRFVNDVWAYIDSFWPEIAALERKTTGLSPKKVEAKLMVNAPDFVTGGYYPIAYDRSMNIQQVFKGDGDIYGDANMAKVGKAQTAQGHLKARESSTGYAIDLNLGVWDHHVMQVVHDLSMREAINDVGRLLSPHGVKTRVENITVVDSIAETLNNKGRASDMAELNLWLRDVAAGEQLSARGWEGYMRFARKALTIKYIGFKTATVLLQPFGLVQSGVTVGNIAMIKGTAKFLRDPLYWKKQIMQRSNMMPNRARLMNREINQFQAEAAMGSSQLDSGAKRWENFVMTWAFVPMQQVQLWFVDMPTWVASFEKNLAKGMTETDAALQADDDVNKSQGSGLLSDRSAIERGTIGNAATRTELVRSFTLLASYMQAKYNVYSEVKGTFQSRTLEDGVLSMAGANALARATGSLLQMFAVEALLVSMLRDNAPDFEDADTEELIKWFLLTTGADFASMHPASRQVGAMLQGFDAQSLPQDALVDMVGKSVKSGVDIAVGEGDVRDFANVADVLLTPFQLPTGQLKQLFFGLASDDPVANTARAVAGLPQPRDN